MDDDTARAEINYAPEAEPGARSIELRRRNGPSLWAVVDEEDYERVAARTWTATIQPRTTYAQSAIRIGGRRTGVLMHRFILGAQVGALEIDHVDTDGLNNRRSNLRLATHAENARNRRSRRNTSSRYKGVSWNKQRKSWEAIIARDGCREFLGHFSDETEAARAYDQRAMELHESFARVNLPEEHRRTA